MGVLGSEVPAPHDPYKRTLLVGHIAHRVSGRYRNEADVEPTVYVRGPLQAKRHVDRNLGARSAQVPVAHLDESDIAWIAKRVAAKEAELRAELIALNDDYVELVAVWNRVRGVAP